MKLNRLFYSELYENEYLFLNINTVELQDKSIGTNKRMKIIAQRRRLVDMAKAQAQEIAVLRAEVERLRMKTFPALVQLD